jgi:hypothetical protein
MLSAAIFLTLFIPFLVAAWLRGIRRKQGMARARIRPRRRTVIGFSNLALLLGAVLAIPQTTKVALKTSGSWPTELILSDSEGNTRGVRISRKIVNWLAATLPGPEPAIPTDNLATPRIVRDGGVADAIERLDGREDAEIPPPEGDEDGEEDASEITLAFERRGSAIIVPVQLGNGRDTIDVKMIFDTGATLTTIDSATMESLGLVTADSTPTISVHTANGKATRQILTVDEISIGAARVRGGLTVALCEPCAQGDVVGLLGLNYSRHFRVILDTDAGKLKLKRKLPSPGHLADIRPFISFKDINGIRRGKKLEVSLTLENKSDRALEEAVVAVIWEKKRYYQNAGFISPNTSKDVSIKAKLDDSRKGTAFKVELHQARW